MLATDSQGRLAVGLLSEDQGGQGGVQLRLGYASATAARVGGGGGSSGTSSFFLNARLDSREAAAEELRRHGLEPLAQPSWAQLEAAVPLALWEDEHVRGMAADCCYCFVLLFYFPWSVAGGVLFKGSAARLWHAAHPLRRPPEGSRV